MNKMIKAAGQNMNQMKKW